MAAKVFSPGQATYSACKGALYMYMGSLATETRGRGIQVTLVCPGPVATGTDSHPRQVYGPEGLVAAKATGLSKSRVPPADVAAYVGKASPLLLSAVEELMAAS